MSGMAIFGYWKNLNNKTLHDAVTHYLQDVPMKPEEVDEMFKYLRGWKILYCNQKLIKQSQPKHYQPSNQGVKQAIQDLLKIGIDPL